jgi:hypothetical protein
MADASFSIALPASSARRTNSGAIVSLSLTRISDFLRRRRVYRQTLAEVGQYSERGLLDIGADHGIEEFARRAARL